jgi:beta-glucanase (GH16 family)
MYILVNLAVGGPGSWPGPPDATTPFPAVMQVDYVRAYQSPQGGGPVVP